MLPLRALPASGCVSPRLHPALVSAPLTEDGAAGAACRCSSRSGTRRSRRAALDLAPSNQTVKIGALLAAERDDTRLLTPRRRLMQTEQRNVDKDPERRLGERARETRGDGPEPGGKRALVRAEKRAIGDHVVRPNDQVRARRGRR